MSFISAIRAAIAKIEPNGPDIAEALARAGYTVHAVSEDPRHGHVAIEQGGGLMADVFGPGTSRPSKARAFLEQHPNALIGVSRAYSSARAVVNPVDKRVGRQRRFVFISDEGSRPHEEAPAKRAKQQEVQPPQPPSVADALAVVRDTLVERARLESELTARRRAVSAIEHRRNEAEHAVARARKKFGDAAADAVAREESIPEQPRLRSAILKGEAEIAGCEAALPSARARVKPAEATLAEHQRDLVEAVLDLDAAITAEVFPILVASLASLAEPLAEFAAVSRVRDRLLGPRFQYNSRRHAPPIGAHQLIVAFIDSVPLVLRPDGLTVESIDTRAAEIASCRLADLETETVKEN